MPPARRTKAPRPVLLGEDFATLSPSARCARVLAFLKAEGSEANRAGMGRFGIDVSAALGISVAKLRALKRETGIDHALALALWRSGLHEARILTVLIADPAQMNLVKIETWLGEIGSWDLCDGLANNLIRRMPAARARIPAWAADEREFVRRAAFSAIAALAVHEELSKREIGAYLALVKRYASDPRNYVKKAVSWALREIGKRDLPARDRALALAEKPCDSFDPAERWVGHDARAELKHVIAVPERRRLLTAKSKIGRKNANA